MAERVGFEPTEPVKAHSISNAANSTTLAPFRNWKLAATCVSRWFSLCRPDGLFRTGFCDDDLLDDNGVGGLTCDGRFIVADQPSI